MRQIVFELIWNQPSKNVLNKTSSKRSVVLDLPLGCKNNIKKFNRSNTTIECNILITKFDAYTSNSF